MFISLSESWPESEYLGTLPEYKVGPCCLYTPISVHCLTPNTEMCVPVVMAEWLRRWTRNPLGSPRAGSNPADYVCFLFCLLYLINFTYSSHVIFFFSCAIVLCQVMTGLLAVYWQRWMNLHPANLATIAEGGYYSTTVMDGLMILSFNSDYGCVLN